MSSSPSIKILKKSKLIVSIRIFSCILARGLFLLLPLIFGWAINHISNGDYSSAFFLVFVGLAVTCLAKASLIFMVYMWNTLYGRLTVEYTKMASENLFLDSKKKNQGEVLNILNNDIDIMSAFFPSLIRRIIRTFEIIVIFIYFFTIGHYFGFASVSATAFCLVVIKVSNIKISRANKKMLESFDNRSNLISQISSKNKHSAKKEDLINYTKDYIRKFRTKDLTEETLRISVIAIVEVFRWGMIIMGIYLYMKDSIEIGVIVIIYTYFSSLIQSFEEFSAISISFEQLKVSENRFKKFIQKKK